VVALDVVLDHDLPVGREIEVKAAVEDERVEVDAVFRERIGPCGDLGERRSVRVGLTKISVPRVSSRSGTSERPLESNPGSRSERGAVMSEPSSAYVHAW
jgi:hypothetical protein